MKKTAILIALMLIGCSVSQAAINSAIVWEVRATGSQTNGGGYKTGATGTDYSQQDAAQWALDPVTSAGATAVMTNASAAATMVGNICYVVSGTNATVGWYEILSVNVGVNFTVDRNWCTGACADGVVNIGGAFDLGGTRDDEWLDSMAAGNTIHVKSGTYPLAEAIYQDGIDGTAVLPITWIGYTAARNDACVGANRPLIEQADYQFRTGTYTIFKNFRGTTTYVSGFDIGAYSTLYNCKWQNTGAATRSAYTSTGGGATWIACEGISDNGNGFNMTAQGTAIACYAHDSATGFNVASYACKVLHSVADTCTTGISMAANYNGVYLNNTIYNCTTGISGTTAYHCTFLNNIIKDCTTGASWTTATPSNYWDFNCWDNTADVSNVTKGGNAVTANPLLNAPADGDFTLQSGSPCLDAGCQMDTNVGAVGDYKVNIGTDQDDNTAAGGGGATMYMGNF